MAAVSSVSCCTRFHEWAYRNKRPLTVAGLTVSVSLSIFSLFAAEGNYAAQGAAQAFWGTFSLGILQIAKYIRTTYYGAVIVTAAQGVGLGLCYASSPKQSQVDRDSLLAEDGLDFPSDPDRQDSPELP